MHDIAVQERIVALQALLDFNLPLTTTKSHIARFPFESQTILLPLEPKHLTHALSLFINNEITASDLEDWANAIEVRDDIQAYDSRDPRVSAILFDLANPVLQGPITHRACLAFCHELRD